MLLNFGWNDKHGLCFTIVQLELVWVVQDFKSEMQSWEF